MKSVAVVPANRERQFAFEIQQISKLAKSVLAKMLICNRERYGFSAFFALAPGPRGHGKPLASALYQLGGQPSARHRSQSKMISASVG